MAVSVDYIQWSQASSGKITGIRSWIGFIPYKDPKDLEHFRENLRKAGLPE